jgi:DNA-directed RNA polymerase subunit M/transcription elongation factor TFIIS
MSAPWRDIMACDASIKEWAKTCNVVHGQSRLNAVRWLHANVFSWQTAMELEEHVFVETQDTIVYEAQMKLLMYNIFINSDLRSADPAELARMSSGQLCQNTVLAVAAREKQLQRDRFTAMLQQRYDELGEERTHSDLQCRKCRTFTRLEMEQKQTRSADEPTTVFVTCTRCKTRWIM